MIDIIIVAVVVALAVWYLFHRFKKMFDPEQGCGCGGCDCGQNQNQNEK